MSEKKIESVIRDFVEAYARRDVEKTLSFLTEDVVWVAPEGTFKGKEEVKRFFTWLAQRTPDLRIRNAGIGILVKGNKAVYEYVFEGINAEGTKFEAHGIDIYEFSGEKIQQLRYLDDRLTIAKQVARGWFARKVVGLVVNRCEKGLH